MPAVLSSAQCEGAKVLYFPHTHLAAFYTLVLT